MDTNTESYCAKIRVQSLFMSMLFPCVIIICKVFTCHGGTFGQLSESICG